MTSSTRKDPRLARTDEALEQALLTLLIQSPFDQITIVEICRTAGIHKATFFRRYESKEALLDKIAREKIDRLVAMTLPVGHNLAGFTALCLYVEEHSALWTALLNGGAAGAMREELLAVSRALVSKGGLGETRLPADLAAVCTVTLIVETISWWLHQPEAERLSPATLAEMLLDMVAALSQPRK